MKKILTSLFLVSLLAVPVIGIAQSEMGMVKPIDDWNVKHDLCDYSPCYSEAMSGNCPQKGNTLNAASIRTLEELGMDITACRLVDKILTIGDWIFTALLVVAIIIILLAAWTFLTASGDPDKVGKGRNYLIYALVGIAVAFLAKFLVRVIANIMV